MNRILIAPLNWGLGHATRCMPIIAALQRKDYEVVLASDGDALEFLKKEYPDLKCLALPSYNIKYPKKGNYLKWKLLANSPKILKAINGERRIIANLVDSEGLDGVISDNRFGVFHNDVPSVFITHQLNVLSGNSSWLSTKMHQRFIKKFDECWIPDIEHEPNLSGKLGHLKTSNLTIKYLEILSRFSKESLPIKYDLMILLSGPEPQRSILENKLIEQLNDYKGKVLFVSGKIEKEQTRQTKNNLTFFNYMQQKELQMALNESDIVLARSGYSTILDLARLEKKAFFIPTPGQFEQEYLAKKMKKDGIAPYCTQDEFTIDRLNSVNNYLGFKGFEAKVDFSELFSLFEGK